MHGFLPARIAPSQTRLLAGTDEIKEVKEKNTEYLELEATDIGDFRLAMLQKIAQKLPNISAMAVKEIICSDKPTIEKLTELEKEFKEPLEKYLKGFSELANKLIGNLTKLTNNYEQQISDKDTIQLCLSDLRTLLDRITWASEFFDSEIRQLLPSHQNIVARIRGVLGIIVGEVIRADLHALELPDSFQTSIIKLLQAGADVNLELKPSYQMNDSNALPTLKRICALIVFTKNKALINAMPAFKVENDIIIAAIIAVYSRRLDPTIIKMFIPDSALNLNAHLEDSESSTIIAAGIKSADTVENALIIIETLGPHVNKSELLQAHRAAGHLINDKGASAITAKIKEIIAKRSKNEPDFDKEVIPKSRSVPHEPPPESKGCVIC